MTVWIVAAGKSRRLADTFVQDEAALFSFKEGGDFRGLAREQFAGRFQGKPYLDPDRNGKRIAPRAADKYASELWKIMHEVKKGDIFFSRFPDGAYLVGRVTGNYEYREERHRDERHVIPVYWVRMGPNALPAQLQYPLRLTQWTIREPALEARDDALVYAERVLPAVAVKEKSK
ncbi:hypothetical protein [Streptomyces sp. NPDC002082]|uniref:hypothetical protein n=1 Tax=Streptomyces sp. NPDC002082 TaxID=3154772 RepID=UPI003321A880